MGRPHHAYSLTAKAHELFSSQDDLALTLLEEVFALKAKNAPGNSSNGWAAGWPNATRPRTLRSSQGSAPPSLPKRSMRGVLTDVSQEAEDVFILQTYNCPYHELAHEHRTSARWMRNSCECCPDVNLHRCMMDGHPSCKFVVHRNLRGKS